MASKKINKIKLNQNECASCLGTTNRISLPLPRGKRKRSNKRAKDETRKPDCNRTVSRLREYCGKRNVKRKRRNGGTTKMVTHPAGKTEQELENLIQHHLLQVCLPPRRGRDNLHCSFFLRQALGFLHNRCSPAFSAISSRLLPGTPNGTVKQIKIREEPAS